MKPKSYLLASAAICAVVTTPALSQITAFPGAQGFGAYATGGRGGDVYTVTNLNGTGAGSLRYGIENAPAAGRTIVFAVSGYIPIANNSDTGNKTIRIVKNKITIAGQTAPGDGIGLKDGRLLLTGDDSVIRHLRIRHGKNGSSGDCLNIESSAERSMIDHVSLMFSTDENISFFNSAVNNFTMQYSTSSWGMERHNAGGLWDLENGSCHHTLWAHHRTRNPKARPNGLLEWINNVTYHWRGEGFIMGDSQSNQTWQANVRGCYYLSIADEDFGLNTKALTKALVADNGQPNFNLYLDNTLMDANGDGILNGTDQGYGIVSGQAFNASEGAAPGANRYGKSATPFPGASGSATVTIDHPLTAYKKVLASSGALRLDAGYSGPLRDELDSLLIKSVEDQDSILVAKDTPVDGDDPPSNGELRLANEYGITNSGFGTLSSAAAPADGDGDGMPDEWEQRLGWNAGSQDHNTALPSSGGIVSAPTFMPANTPAGFTRLEEYLHFKSSPHAILPENGTIDVDLRKYTRGFQKAPITYAFSNVSNGTVSLLSNGYTARFVPTAGYTGRARFDFAVTDGDGSNWTQSFLILAKSSAVSAPSTPSGLSAKAGAAMASVSWNSVSGATGYVVKRATTSGGPYTSVATVSYTTHFLDTGLSNGVTYYYVVAATNAGGSSANSSQVTVAPGATASVTLQAEDSVLGGGTVASTNTAGYKGSGYANYPATGGTTTFNNVNGGSGGSAQLVFRFGLVGTDSRTGTLTINGVSQNLTFPPTDVWENWSTFAVTVNLAAGATNTIVITSTGADLASVDEMTIIPTGGIVSGPSIPTGLGATVSGTQIALSWSASSGATSYNVKRATTSGGPYTVISSPAGPSFTNTGLANGTYYYVVSAVNSGGESVNSSQASGTITTGGTATTIQAEAGTIINGTFDSNNAGFNGTGFANLATTGGSLQFDNVSGGPGGAATLTIRFALGNTARTGNLVINGVTQAITFPSTTTFTNWVAMDVPVTLTSGNTNTIRFETTGQDLANIDEITITASASPTVPPVPAGLNAAAGNAQVALSWTASSGATSYNIKRSTTSGSGYTTVGTSSGTSYNNTGLTNGTTYYYVVSAVNGGGESANSSQASATPQPPAPSTPTGLSATAGNGQAALTWSASSGAASYNIKRSTTSGSGYTTVGTASGTSYTNTGLTNGTIYYYVVSAVNGGGESTNSSQASATPQPPAPAAPTGVVATAGDAQASLIWTASSGATSYNIKRSTTSGSGYTTVGTASGTSYNNTGLTNGTTYYYVVSAVNGGGESSNSSQASATPQPPAPSAPTGLAATAGNGQAALTWSASATATSYNIKRSTTSGSGYATVGTVSGTNYTNTGLTNGTTYYYVVSAVNGGGESPDSTQAVVSPIAPVLTGLLAYEGFAYAAGSSIAGQGGGFGWGANWSSTGNPQDVSATQAASLASGSLLTSGGSAKFGPSSAGGSTSSGVYMRQLGNTIGSLAAGGNGTVWLSLFYLNSTSGADASGYYGEARIGLYSGVTATSGVTQTSGATNVLNAGTPTTSASVLDRVSLYLGTTVSATGTATPRGSTPAHLLLKIVADNTTATDTVYLWVNPNVAAGEPVNNTAHASWTTANLSAVNGLRFQQTGSNGGVVDTVDEIRLGRTFGDVTASSTLPSPWTTADIGSVAATGNAGHSTGVFTVTGSGSGIAGTADEFRSVHQSGSGDCSITARVTAINTGASARAGVSIRESTTDTSAQASCLVSNGTVSFVYRTSTGGATTTVPVSGVNPPRWVKIERVGSTFTASHSADGLTWSTAGSADVTMAATTTLGTVVTSQADGTLATGTIDQITATP